MTSCRRVRRAEPRIVDPATHPRASVCLAVAAEWLGMDARSLLARIEDSRIPARRDGRIYRIDVSALVAYAARRRA